jgi:hypothetical protein
MFTFKRGDKGKAILQIHERGLTENQARKLGSGFFFGWDPVRLDTDQITRLKELAPGNWASALRRAESGPTEGMPSIGKVNLSELSAADKRLVGLVNPVSIHTDIRMQPTGKNEWEGATLFTPGNQFKENKFREMESYTRIPGVFKLDKEYGIAHGSPAWMKVGDGTPKIYPPGAAGSTSDAWSRFKIVDKFTWEAGTQDENYKEFMFKGGKVMNGRWIFTNVPIGDGTRRWMLSRPGNQEMDKPKDNKVIKEADGVEMEAGDDLAWTMPILKSSDEQRTVTGVVLEPEVTDSHGDIYSDAVIKEAAHNYMIEYQKMGIMHRDFRKSSKIHIVESFIAPQPMKLGNQHIQAGSWVMTVKVLDDDIWDDVKAGKLRAFSIGGIARTIPVK